MTIIRAAHRFCTPRQLTPEDWRRLRLEAAIINNRIDTGLAALRAAGKLESNNG